MPSAEGKNTQAAWRTAVLQAREKLLAVGVHIDAAQHHDNFIKDAAGVYWYIDTIGIPNPKHTAMALENAILQYGDGVEGINPEHRSMMHALKKFKKIAGIESSVIKSNTT